MNTEKTEFLDLDTASSLLQDRLGGQYDAQLFQTIRDKFLVTPVVCGTQVYLHRSDLRVCEKLLRLNSSLTQNELGQYGYTGSFFEKRIKIAPGTFLIYPFSDKETAVPAFVRNIVYQMQEGQADTCEICQIDMINTTIVTTNLQIRSYVQNALYRKHQIGIIKQSNFANSSSYMGSKRKIAGFIVEAMFPYTHDNSVFLDIMCGSGSVSNALAQIGNVWASDAQEFCCLLAKIQGHGFCRNKAEKIIHEIYPFYLKNANQLKSIFARQLQEEDRIFHMDTNQAQKVFECYSQFTAEFELYSSGCSNQTILSEIELRKQTPKQFPYCLFTYYFSNVYFGLSQSIQLDSLRFAIDQLTDPEDRNWALGVLVVVTSLIATTYAGHFAQPKRLEQRTLEQIIEQRQKSAWLEFSKRLLSIAEESKRYPYPVQILAGPWETALEKARALTQQQLIVYLDAPYKREEYSRYYHVLETIVKYDYPSSEGKGRLRSKAKGERFSTAFFSKTKEKIEYEFVNIIGSILKANAICVWSYSNNGDASIINVVDQITAQYDCSVYFYGTPYIHQSQGKSPDVKRKHKNVIEYCIIFTRKEGCLT